MTDPKPAIEPIPDNCFPPPVVVEQLLRGPDLDDQGRIIGGVYAGMTPAQVLADRDAYNQACGE